ncbi:transposase [Pseudomonas sp. IT-P100]
MDSNQRMIIWSSAWTLVEGQVVCTGCMREQPIFQSEQTFIHEPRCIAKSAVETVPWAELHQILD